MTVATAERVVFDDQQAGMEQIPLVIAVPEMAEDVDTRSRAAEFIGKCIARREVDTSDNESQHLATKPIESLYDAIRMAAEGDTEARKMVKTNVTTEAIEITQKVKNVNRVKQSVDEANRIHQHGQSQESIQANTLRYVSDNLKMKPRVEAEVRNSFRISKALQEKLLESHVIAVFSPVADNMNQEELAEADFFTDTMTCMIQVTSAEGDELTVENAMVAGVKKPGGERHDLRGIHGVGERLGVKFAGKNAAEIIDTPILIPRWMLPNGASDLAEMYDAVLEDETGEVMLFGQSLGADEQKDYKVVVEKSKEIQARFQPKLEAATNDLIAKASKIKSRMQAFKALHKVVEKHMVLQAVADTDINPKVFGPAAPDILEARIQLQLGNHEQALVQTARAIKNAVSSSCPSALKSGLDVDGGGGNDNDEKSFSWHGGKIKNGTCVNCKEKTAVGVKNWCEKCISGHCGTKKS